MKYFMLVLFSALYMSSVAYGSDAAMSDCEAKKKGHAMSSVGAFTGTQTTTAPSQGTEVKN